MCHTGIEPGTSLLQTRECKPKIEEGGEIVFQSSLFSECKFCQVRVCARELRK